VGVVVDLGNLATQFGRTTDQWFAFLTKTAGQQGTVAQFAPSIANLQGEGTLLDTLSGDAKVTQAQQLVTDSQTLLTNMATALQNILTMINTITSTTASTIQSYQNKLLTSAELEAQARVSYTTDVAAIATAANPTEVQAAWQKVMTDLSSVLDAIVARIQAIQALQLSYATFRTQMATDAGPQFATDPSAWLAQNMTAIQAVTTTLKTA